MKKEEAIAMGMPEDVKRYLEEIDKLDNEGRFWREVVSSGNPTSDEDIAKH